MLRNEKKINSLCAIGKTSEKEKKSLENYSHFIVVKDTRVYPATYPTGPLQGL